MMPPAVFGALKYNIRHSPACQVIFADFSVFFRPAPAVGENVGKNRQRFNQVEVPLFVHIYKYAQFARETLTLHTLYCIICAGIIVVIFYLCAKRHQSVR